MSTIDPCIARSLRIRRPVAWAMTAAFVATCGLFCGCAAITNPVAEGIPVRLLPPELLGESRNGKQTIPLTLLRQRQPDVYRLGPGDVLGVYIEGVLGTRGVGPEVVMPQGVNLTPAIGVPVPVRDNGTLSLPLIKPVPIEGLTVPEAEEAIVQAYTVASVVIKPGRERIIVTLMQPRQTRVFVVRQDSPTGGYRTIVAGGPLYGTRSVSGGAEQLQSGGQRGTGNIVDLPAYENDVLGALVRTGGLPGLDAKDEVIVERGTFDVREDPAAVMQRMQNGGPTPGTPGKNYVRIPLRLGPGEPIPFGPEDIILRPGDIVFIAARNSEVFYSGGLLPAGEFPLPRDYDLNVTDAVAAIGGPMVNGAFGGNNLSGAIVQTGIGFPSPSLLTVVRRTPCGQVPIRVDLGRALRDQRENIAVLPGDVLILQETPSEATARYFTNVFRFDFLWNAITGPRTTGNVTTVVP